MTQPRITWNEAAAKHSAIAHYRSWAEEHVRKAKEHNRAGELRQEIRHWEAACIASAAADREADPDRPEAMW